MMHYALQFVHVSFVKSFVIFSPCEHKWCHTEVALRLGIWLCDKFSSPGRNVCVDFLKTVIVWFLTLGARKNSMFKVNCSPAVNLCQDLCFLGRILSSDLPGWTRRRKRPSSESIFCAQLRFCNTPSITKQFEPVSRGPATAAPWAIAAIGVAFLALGCRPRRQIANWWPVNANNGEWWQEKSKRLPPLFSPGLPKAPIPRFFVPQCLTAQWEMEAPNHNILSQRRRDVFCHCFKHVQTPACQCNYRRRSCSIKSTLST